MIKHEKSSTIINETGAGTEEEQLNARKFYKQESDTCYDLAISFKKPSRPKFDLTEKFKLLKPAAETLIETKLEFLKTTNFNSA